VIDTHCHLTDPRLASQVDAVLFRAAAAGVTRCVTIATGLDDARACLDVCRGRPNVRCAVGVHPAYVDRVEPADLPPQPVEPVVVAEDALQCVALGTGRALEEIKRLRSVLSSMY